MQRTPRIHGVGVCQCPGNHTISATVGRQLRRREKPAPQNPRRFFFSFHFICCQNRLKKNEEIVLSFAADAARCHWPQWGKEKKERYRARHAFFLGADSAAPLRLLRHIFLFSIRICFGSFFPIAFLCAFGLLRRAQRDARAKRRYPLRPSRQRRPQRAEEKRKER